MQLQTQVKITYITPLAESGWTYRPYVQRSIASDFSCQKHLRDHTIVASIAVKDPYLCKNPVFLDDFFPACRGRQEGSNHTVGSTIRLLELAQ